MKTSVIILTWNGLELTKRCLNSLLSKKLPKDVEIIVVDNGSTDGTIEYLKNHKNIKLIQNGENLGYGKAVNIGILASSKNSDIILLNNDVELIQKDWLSRLQSQAQAHEKYGVIGVKILQENGLIQHCGAYLPVDTWWGQQVSSNEVDIGQYAGISECESVVFACAYIKREVLEKIGFLDERFFAYFEDTDFCLRANQAGYKVAIDGGIKVKHAENSSTKINNVSHSNIFLESQKKFKEKWHKSLQENRYSNGNIDFHSIVNFPSGYAGSTRAFLESLDRNGVKASYKYVYGPGTVFPVEEPLMSDSYIVNMVSARPFGKAKTQVVYAQGDVFEKNSGKYKVGFTMLEVDGLPSEWVRQANLMDEVWVPSTFNRSTFENSGVKVPIHVIPLGVDPAYFSPSIIGYKPDHVFTFLSVFEWGERKAPELLIKAFSDEFSKSEDAVLICKANNFDPSVNIQLDIENLNLRKNGGRIVLAQNRILERYELGSLYKSADCFVLPTRGEGWGMPILEAMACGLPVIATNWSSQVDFMTKENSLPIDVEGLIPAKAKCPYYEGFNWANPSYEHLRYLMRWVFENQKKANEIGQKAAQDVRVNWTWDKAVEKMIRRLQVIS